MENLLGFADFGSKFMRERHLKLEEWGGDQFDLSEFFIAAFPSKFILNSDIPTTFFLHKYHFL